MPPPPNPSKVGVFEIWKSRGTWALILSIFKYPFLSPPPLPQVISFFYFYNFPFSHAGVMGCGTAKATDLSFVCFVIINPCVLSSANRVDFGLFCFINFPFLLPPHQPQALPRYAGLPPGKIIRGAAPRKAANPTKVGLFFEQEN